MTNITAQFGSLTLATKLASSVSQGDVVAGVDGRQTSRNFNPSQFVGFGNAGGPQTGDAASKWLPAVSVKTQFTADNDGTSVNGAVRLQLSVPSALGSYYTSPLNFLLAPDDLVTVATGTF